MQINKFSIETYPKPFRSPVAAKRSWCWLWPLAEPLILCSTAGCLITTSNGNRTHITAQRAGVSPDNVKITGNILIDPEPNPHQSPSRCYRQNHNNMWGYLTHYDKNCISEMPKFANHLCEHGPPLGWPMRSKLRAVIFEKASPLGGLASHFNNVHVKWLNWIWLLYY